MAPKKIKFSKYNKIHRFKEVPIIFTKRTKCWTCCEPLFYGFIAIIIVLALIFLAAILLTLFPIPLQRIRLWIKQDKSFMTYQSTTATSGGIGSSNNNSEMVPCTRLTIHKVWSKAISRLNSETPVRKVDLNGDGVEDIVIGYGIGELVKFTIIIH